MSAIRLLTLVCTVVLFCSFIPTGWVLVQSKEGNFKMNFPRQPTQSSQDVESPIGKLKVNLFMYEVGKFKDDNGLYGVIYSKYPDSLVNSDFKDEILDEFFKQSINGMVNNIKGTVAEEQKTTYKGYPGRNVKISFMDGAAFMHVRVLLVKNVAYIMEVACETAKDNNPGINDFFNSFALLNEKKAVAH